MEICLNIFGRRRRSRRRNAIKEWRFPIALTILFFFLCFCAPFISCQNPQILPESMSLMTIGADVISYKKATRLEEQDGYSVARDPLRRDAAQSAAAALPAHRFMCRCHRERR
ncbi:hypothetical protein SASPL_138213 [Salvia splendens]|uniref:Uncharacterized protein n=1 Tax=Salvia splendens TaxID=180675 RepID=A0A8X8WV25_SALSN|nr:hypothetical protein SASPL_138213 [Salvia splendens]